MSPMVLGRRCAVLAALVVAGCGFRPVYGARNDLAMSGQGELAAIDVGLIPERTGQLLRQALQQRMNRSDDAPAKRYQLTVSLGISGDAIGIQQDSTATRLRQVATAAWSLKMLDPARTLVANGTARALDGVNIIDQQYFAADLEGEAAQRRITDAVADQITLQVAAFFARRSLTGEA